MKRAYFTLVFVLAMFFGNAYSQEKNVDREKFADSFHRNFRFPLDISEECKSSYVSVVLKIADNKVSKIEFSANATPSLKAEFNRLKPILEEANWKGIFPGLENRKDFTVFLPLIYYFSFECYEKITSEDFRRVLEDGFNLGEGERQPYYMLPPFVIKVGKPKA